MCVCCVAPAGARLYQVVCQECVLAMQVLGTHTMHCLVFVYCCCSCLLCACIYACFCLSPLIIMQGSRAKQFLTCLPTALRLLQAGHALLTLLTDNCTRQNCCIRCFCSRCRQLVVLCTSRGCPTSPRVKGNMGLVVFVLLPSCCGHPLWRVTGHERVCVYMCDVCETQPFQGRKLTADCAVSPRCKQRCYRLASGGWCCSQAATSVYLSWLSKKSSPVKCHSSQPHSAPVFHNHHSI